MFSIGNAAGTLNHRLDEVEALARTAVTHITIGPLCRQVRPGNTGDHGDGDLLYIHPTELWSLNSKGLPSLGWMDFRDVIRAAAEIAHKHGKKLRVTIAPFSPQEAAALTLIAYACGADEVEINCGCPNVWGEDGSQKPIPSYHPPLVAAILKEVGPWLPPGKEVDVKVSPIEDPLVYELATVFKEFPCVGNIVAVNAKPNVDRMREDGVTHALNFNGGNHLGGLGGDPEVLEEGLRVVRLFRQLLPTIGIIGVGGILKGEHALQHLEAGANGIQSATGYLHFGPKFFNNTLEELSRFSEAEKYLAA